MKFAQWFFALVVPISGVRADIASVPPDSEQEKVAAAANSVDSVTNIQSYVYAYKIVALDSSLNGDLQNTTMVLVGDKDVGGEAGYLAAFQLSPSHQLRSFKSAKKRRGEIEVSFYGSDMRIIKRLYHYDDASKTLIESPELFTPIHIVHSVGKAFTQCQDAHEQEQHRKHRPICVNADGDFYYLAE